MTGQAELLQLLRRAPVTADQRRIDVTDAAPVRLRGKSTVPDASSSTREHQKSAVDAS